MSVLASPEARERGRASFLEHCAICHGEAADGRGARGRFMRPPPANLRSSGVARRLGAEGIRALLASGRPGTAMGSWASLGGPALDDLTAYVWSISKER